MAEVIKLHARASTGAAAAKASKVMSGRPLSAAKRTSAAQRCAGIPLARQVLTVLAGTSKASATALVPPRALIAVLGVSDIGANIVRATRTCQGFAKREAIFIARSASIVGMADDLKLQAKRLTVVREVCFRGTREKFALKLGLSKGHWSDFENGKRPLTLDVARKIKALYKLPIEWLLDGEEWALEFAPAHIVRKIEAFAA